MRRSFQGIFSVSVVILSLVLLAVGGIHAASDPVIAVDPIVVGAAPTESFSVDVTIADVADLYSWQFNLTFNPSVLEAVEVEEGSFMKQFRTTLMATPNINNTAGWVFVGVAFLDWEEVGASGSGVLATVSFTGVSTGTSSLHISEETGLRTYDGENIMAMAYEAVDGVFAYPRDLAVTGLVASPLSVQAGELVSLNATVMNNGIVDEIFNVTFYRDSAIVGMQSDLALDSGASTVAVFTWDTSGVAAGSYVMKAEIIAVSGENDTTNNLFSDGTVTIEAAQEAFTLPIEWLAVIVIVVVVVVASGIFLYMRSRSKKS